MTFEHQYLRGPAPHAIAHRGGSERPDPNEPWGENTLSAFRSAYAVGFRMMETDVHLTADGVVVAFHDDVLDRVTDGSGPIAAHTWDELKNFRVNGEEPIPQLEELLRELPDVRFNIDPKSDAVVDAFIDVLHRCDALDRVCIGAFSDARLDRIRLQLGPDACIGSGPSGVLHWHAALAGEGEMPDGVQVFQVPPTFGETAIVTAESVALAHAHGIAVHVWTIDDPREMNRLLDLGVDGIMTDRPGTLRDVLTERGDWG